MQTRIAITLAFLLVSACSDDPAAPNPPASDNDDDDDTTDKAEPDDDSKDEDPVTASTDSGRSNGRADASTSTPDLDAGKPEQTDDKSDARVIADDAGKPPVSSGGSCLAGITDFGKTGPFKFSAKPAGKIKMWVPDVPAGCKVPVIHLANGTTATCSAYQNVLNTFASHGFLTTCYEDPNTGAGTQGLEAFQKAVEMYPDLADRRFGSTGHSQGGQAAFTVLALTEAKFGSDAVYAGLAMEPASGYGTQPSGGTWQQVYAKIKSPMFMFSGTSDTLVSASWVQRGFDALDDSIEAYNWSASGATHIPTPQAETQEVGVPWFRWKLLGDNAACKAFKALAGAGRWKEVKSQNPVQCE